MSTPRSFNRAHLQPKKQNSNNFRQNRPFERRDYPNNNNTEQLKTMNTEQAHHTSRTKINLGIGEVTKTIPDCLQRRDNIPPSEISADNPDQIRLTLQCLTGLGTETRATIYLTTRNSQLPTTVTSQTWFDSLQQTMKLTDNRDYVLQTTEVSEFNY